MRTVFLRYVVVCTYSAQILEIAQFVEFAEIASDKGENGKFTVLLKRSRGVGRLPTDRKPP